MRRADAVCALGVLLLAAVVTAEGWRLGIGWSTDGPQSGFFVFYLGVALGLASMVVLVQTGRGAGASVPGRPFLKRSQVRPVATVLAPAAGMVLLTHATGLYVAGGLYLAVYMRWIGRHSWPVTVLLGVGVPVVTFLIFERWFLVPMPKGPLEAWLGY